MEYRKTTKLILSILFFVLTSSSFAQINRDYLYTYDGFNEEAGGNLYLRFEGTSFFKNDEYFGDFIEGYTLLGYSVQPSLMYYVSPKLRIKAGVHLLKFDGVDDFSKVIPIYSAQLELANNFDVIIGSLKGGVQHRLIEPLYDPELQYVEPVENGLQFLYNGKKFWADTWVNWTHFIFHGDTVPERFTYGLSCEYTLLKSQGGLRIGVPFQFTAWHVGGQISNYKEELTTVANMASGVKIEKEFGGGFIRSVGLSAYWLSFNDLTDGMGLDFDSGNAVYPELDLRYKYGELMTGYWRSRNFIAPLGSSLFHSVSSRDKPYYKKERRMLNAKLSYVKKFSKQIKFSALFESYYDLDATSFEYAYGVNLVFTPNFFISKIKVE